MSSNLDPLGIYNITTMELVYHDFVRPSMRQKIEFLDNAYELFRIHWHYQKIGLVEQSKLMLLNSSKRVLGLCDLTTGEASSIHIDPKLIFAPAILANASSIIVARNNIKNEQLPIVDERIDTNRLMANCKLLGMELFDRLVFTEKGYYSYKEAKEHYFPWND